MKSTKISPKKENTLHGFQNFKKERMVKEKQETPRNYFGKLENTFRTYSSVDESINPELREWIQLSLYPFCGIGAMICKNDFGERGIHTELEKIANYYGGDIFFTLGMYSILRAVQIAPVYATSMVATISITIELGQRVRTDRGTYDPYDFLAYGLGLGAAYFFDKGLSSENPSKN